MKIESADGVIVIEFKLGFNIRYSIAADFHFLIRSLILNKTFVYIDIDIAYYNINGFSSSEKLYSEYRKILQEELGLQYNYSFSKKNIWKNIIKTTICGLIGYKNWLYCRGWKDLKK